MATSLAIRPLAQSIGASVVMLSSSLVAASVTVDPITWNVIGLDSNKPATAQPAPQVYPPDRYPVGVEVCNTSGSALSDHKAVFVWDESPSPNYLHLWDSTVNWNDTDGNGDPITSNDGEAPSELPVPDLAAGACADVYFWVQIEQVDAAYDFTRDYHIEIFDDSATPLTPATDGTKVGETPHAAATLAAQESRELYVEYLVSQNRNAIITGYTIDGVAVAKGGSVAIKPGDTIELVVDAKTATQGYEQLEVFLALPPDLFTINSVRTTYSANAGTDLEAGNQLYADGCGWVNDPANAGYHNNGSCGVADDDGKYGGVIQQTYSITVSPSFASSGGFTTQTLIYDFSGSSYHYNSDYETGGLSFTVDNTPVVSSGDLSLEKTSQASGNNSFFTLTLTNSGANTLATTAFASDAFVLWDELPTGYETKSGGANQLSIIEFDATGTAKGTQPSAAQIEAQLDFYNLSPNQAGGPDTSDGPDYDSGERHIIWGITPVNDLAPGESIAFTFQVQSQNGAVGDGAYTNCAEIITRDDDVSNNSACATLLPPSWDLATSKRVVSVSGNSAVFEVSVTNRGPDTSVATYLEDIVPAGYAVTAGSFVYSGDVNLAALDNSADVASGILVWNVPALTLNQRAVVRYTTTVLAPTGTESSEADLNARYLNTVRILDASSDPGTSTYDAVTDRISLNDGDVFNNSASASAAPTLLEIDKTPDTGIITSTTYAYALTVTKVGAFLAGDIITVVEAPPPGMTITAIGGSGWACTPSVPTTDDVTCTRVVASSDPAIYPDIDVAVRLDPVPSGSQTYVNTSFVEGSRGGSVLFNTFDSDSVTASTLEADLSLTKVASDTTPNVGDTVTFTLTLQNDGPDTATNVTVEDALPAGYSYVSGSISGGDSHSATPGSLTWTVSSLANGATTALSYQAVVQAAGPYVNTAQVTASDLPDPDSTPNNDDGDQSEDDEAAETLTPVPLIDLSLSKSTNVLAAQVGTEVTYTITLANAGPSTATNVQVTDTLPTGLAYVASSANQGGAPSGNTVVWNIASLASGASVDLTYRATAASAGTLRNIVEVTAADQVDIDSTPNNDDGDQSEDDESFAEVAFSLNAPPAPSYDLAVQKSVDKTTAAVGESVQFTIAVTLTGDTATGVSVAEALPGGYTLVSATPSVGVYSGGTWSIGSLVQGASPTLTITATVKASGSYLNTATVTSACSVCDTDPSNDSDSASVTPSLTLSGRVFEETSKAYDGLLTTESPTNGGGLYVCIDTPTPQFVAVGSGGTGLFEFTGLTPNTTYSLTLTSQSGGAACPFTSDLNTNWYSTGESVDGTTTDSTVVAGETLSDGKLSVALGSSSVTTLTFGIAQGAVFDPPFGLKTGEFLDGQPVIRWTMVWINDSPIIVNDALITDPPPTGTTYVPGSIVCTPAGITTVDFCNFDTGNNRVEVQADFGPETGSPIDAASAANELVISFDVTYDTVNPEPQYINQGTLTWDPGSGAQTALTDDPTPAGGSDPTVLTPPPVAAAPTPVPLMPWPWMLVMIGAVVGLGRRYALPAR